MRHQINEKIIRFLGTHTALHCGEKSNLHCPGIEPRAGRTQFFGNRDDPGYHYPGNALMGI
jgi:hypothetical protein